MLVYLKKKYGYMLKVGTHTLLSYTLAYIIYIAVFINKLSTFVNIIQ